MGSRDPMTTPAFIMNTTTYPGPDFSKCQGPFNRTVFIIRAYEGIPENLLINCCGWVLLLVVFALLRRVGDYGRLALFTPEKKALVRAHRSYNVWTSLFYADSDNARTTSNEAINPRGESCFSWIPNVFCLKDEQYLYKCGRDAVQYLMFQRYLLAYTAIVTVLSLAIILPINFQGSLQGDEKVFGHSTISNLRADSPLLWVHSVVAVAMLIIAAGVMRLFSSSMKYYEENNVSHTLMIRCIPRDRCFRNILIQHFAEAYDGITVRDVQFTYNISKLVQLDNKRTAAHIGRVTSEEEIRNHGERPRMVPRHCGQLCCCCGTVDATEFYAAEERRLAKEAEEEKVHAFQDALGIAFVSFTNSEDASRVYKDFNALCVNPGGISKSSVGLQLRTHRWEVSYAPHSEDIYWENLSVQGPRWWIRSIAINVPVFLFLFFLTTPSVILSLLSNLYDQGFQSIKLPAYISEFVPTLLLRIVTALLPVLVSYTSYWEAHWTRTSQNESLMKKTFVYLLFMVLILPSLSLNSAEVLLHLDKVDENIRWSCIFRPESLAFFVNYVITSAFVGTVLELLRFGELFMYAMRMLYARSPAEKRDVRTRVTYQFEYGVQYAWMLTVITLVICYSIICPLIAPFGLVYLALKHLVDRYNLYYAYSYTTVDKRIHKTAVTCVLVAVIMLQFTFLILQLIRRGDGEAYSPIAIVQISVIVAAICVLLFRSCFSWCRKLGPFQAKPSGSQDVEQLTSEPSPPTSLRFVPPILDHPLPTVDQSFDNAPDNDHEMTVPETAIKTGYGSVNHELEDVDIGIRR